MRIATWNVNSLKQRLERVEEWLDYTAPDIVCLQETKVADTAFPSMAFSALGYDSAHHGQGQWNGVAILSRVGIDDVRAGFADDAEPDPEARLISATCGGVRVASVYVPNGRALEHEQYRYKLSWLDRLLAHLGATVEPGAPVAVCGDFNIAPHDRDVYDPSAFVESTHTSAEERAALDRLLTWGLVDVFRARYPDTERLFTWWDYRAGMFHKHLGMRIDLVLTDPALADRATWACIDRNARKGKGPSDHAPLIVDFEVEVPVRG